jgi:molybdopterin/thiamine biosynthesis adenylyltransferase
MPWWEAWNGRLDYELDALTRFGYRHKKDQAAFDEGRLVLDIEYPHPATGEAIALQAVFPDSYPYFAPNVSSDSLELPRHQHPFVKTLCLLKGNNREWSPSEDTLARLLQEQLPLLLNVVSTQDPAFISDNEDHIGEPFTNYVTQYSPDSHALIGQWELPEGATTGELLVGYHSAQPFTGTVLEVRGAAGVVLGAMDNVHRDRYKNHTKGMWVLLPKAPSTDNPNELVQLAATINSKAQNPKIVSTPHVLGIAFYDELQWNQSQLNWLFVVRTREAPASKRAQPQIRSHLPRPIFADRDTVTSRISTLYPLADKTVALFGLGAIGSPLAMHLAQSGVGELRLVDRDFVEPGNTARTVYRWDSAGKFKSVELGELIALHHPYTRVNAAFMHVGHASRHTVAQHTEGHVTDTVLAQVDLIVDASAEGLVNHYLSDLARSRGIPYVWVYTTPGAWGGVVGRIIPGETEGCWFCSREAMVSEGIPVPPQDPTADEHYQPLGCSLPSFPGARIDSEEVVLMAGRMIADLLCRDRENAYPIHNWDVAVVSLRDDKGNPTAPQWWTGKLQKHANCPCHGE